MNIYDLHNYYCLGEHGKIVGISHDENSELDSEILDLYKQRSNIFLKNWKENAGEDPIHMSFSYLNKYINGSMDDREINDLISDFEKLVTENIEHLDMTLQKNCFLISNFITVCLKEFCFDKVFRFYGIKTSYLESLDLQLSLIESAISLNNDSMVDKLFGEMKEISYDSIQTAMADILIAIYKKHIHRAISSTNELLGTHGRSSVLLNMLGICYLQLSDPERAKDMFIESNKQNGKCSGSLANMFVACKILGEDRKANMVLE